jgi:acetyltransferase-like isoleucine patch superfamily enzyme
MKTKDRHNKRSDIPVRTPRKIFGPVTMLWLSVHIAKIYGMSLLWKLFNQIYVWVHPACRVGSRFLCTGRIIWQIDPRASLNIGNKVRIHSGTLLNSVGGYRRSIIRVYMGAQLRISDGSGLSSITIVCTNSINIGKNVFIGGGCEIYDTDFHSLDYEKRITKPGIGVSQGPVLIEDGAFIGAHCIILKDLTIGQKSIIGAGSVVTCNVPAREIWAGNPARFIRKL